jgi:toxin ParE1/3/4
MAYIHAERPSAARDFRRRFDAALRRLIDFPESGRVIPEFPGLGFREVLVDSYRLFYRVCGEVIWVVGVWHDAQMPGEPEGP